MQNSIVKFKELEKGSIRLDSEFYAPRYLELDHIFSGIKTKELGDLVQKIDVGHVGLMVSEYNEKGVLLLQTQNIREFFIDISDCKKINLDFHQKLKKSQVKYGDVLIARSGSFGQASIYLEKEIINSADIIIVEAKTINPFYLVAFLNSRLGAGQLFRFASGGLQGHVNLTILENLILPILSKNFQQKIELLIKKAYSFKKDSKSLYSEAEQFLLSELGLLDWKPKHGLSFIKNYSDTQKVERFDAEYFQPQYEEVVEAVKKYKNGFDELGNLAELRKCIEPGSGEYKNKGIPFVRVSNLSKFGILNNNQQFISEDLYQRIKEHQPQKGEILLSKDATPGVAYYLQNSPDKMIPSGGILRLRIKNSEIAGEYLTLVLNSTIVRQQILRDSGGSVILHWRPDQIKKVVIPLLDSAQQVNIQHLIKKSFSFRESSQSLLEIAKKGVERAIEKNEKEAERWIEEELKTLKVRL